MTTALETLSRQLCPWLEPALEQFETARRTGSLGHAWLISGPAGIGKLNLALVLARRLLGDDRPPTPLSAAAALEALAARHEPADRHPDLHWLHPEEEKETISVEQVRNVIETLTLTAHRGGAKVAVIEPAEALTTAAANALLKTLVRRRLPAAADPSAGTPSGHGAQPLPAHVAAPAAGGNGGGMARGHAFGGAGGAAVGRLGAAAVGSRRHRARHKRIQRVRDSSDSAFAR